MIFKRKLIRWVPALLLGLCISGCSSITQYYDDFFGRSDPKLLPKPLSEFTPTAAPKISWQANVGSSESFVFSPALDTNVIYAAGKAGKLVGFDAASGKIVWQAESKQAISGGVGSNDDVIAVGTSKGEVLAFGKKGELVWTSKVSSEVLSAPQISDSLVVVRTVDGRIFGLSRTDGKRKWVYQRAVPVLTVRSNVGILLIGGGVFAGFPGGKLVSLDITNGTVGLELTVAQPRGVTDLERVTDITSLPWVEQRIICAVAYQGRLACFDPRKGAMIWAREISSIAGLTADDKNVYVSDEHSVVLALDKGTGASVWRQDKLFMRRLSTPQVFGNYVVVGDYEGYVHFFRRDNGAIAARIATDGSPISVQPLVTESHCIIQTRAGGVFAISLQ